MFVVSKDAKFVIAQIEMNVSADYKRAIRIFAR